MPGVAALGAGPDPEESYDFLFKLVLIGDASVGKTCLVQRFKTGAFSERQGSTIGVDFTMKSLEIQGKRVKVRALGPRGSLRPGPGPPSPAARSDPGGTERAQGRAGPGRFRPEPGQALAEPGSCSCAALCSGSFRGCLQGRRKLSWTAVFPERDVELAD